MKVVFDYQAFFQTVGGISRCFVELMKHFGPDCIPELAMNTTYNEYVISCKLFPHVESTHLTETNYLPGGKFKGRNKLFRCLSVIPSFPSFENVNSKYAIKFLSERDYDIFHPTFYDSYFEDCLKKVPIVTTIHDMTWEKFPEKGMNVWSKKKYRQAQIADKIIAVSENTKKDIIRIWNIPEDKIDVVYHGCPQMFNISDCTLPMGGRPYFLFVGRRDDYKDFNTAVRAFAQFSKANREFCLVCTGANFSKNELRLINDLGISSQVIVSMVNDLELANLYSHATALLFPSLYEGFGIPITEAMTFGCPMILSNASCFPEIAGDAAMYFKPGDYFDLFARMNELSEMSEIERNDVICKEKVRASLFSWENASRKLESIYLTL